MYSSIINATLLSTFQQKYKILPIKKFICFVDSFSFIRLFGRSFYAGAKKFIAINWNMLNAYLIEFVLSTVDSVSTVKMFILEAITDDTPIRLIKVLFKVLLIEN